MLNFIKELKKQDEKIRVANEDGLKAIRVLGVLSTKSGLDISIQCSKYHYCTPQKTVNIEDYESYEVALFKNKTFVNLEEIDDFERVDELYDHFDGVILAFTPKDLVEDLFNYLNRTKEDEEEYYTFSEAQELLLNGHKVKLPNWQGYAVLNNTKNCVEFHLPNGEKTVLYDINCTYQNNWIIANPNNCLVLKLEEDRKDFLRHSQDEENNEDDEEVLNDFLNKMIDLFS